MIAKAGRRGLTLDVATPGALLPSPLVLAPPGTPHTPLSIKQLLTLLTFPSLEASPKVVFKILAVGPLQSPPQEGPSPTESTISWQL